MKRARAAVVEEPARPMAGTVRALSAAYDGASSLPQRELFNLGSTRGETMRALGIDLAGDGGGKSKGSATGVVEVRLGEGRLEVVTAKEVTSGRSELIELCRSFDGVIAIDQPLGYSVAHEAMLRGEPVDASMPSDMFRYRDCDRRARAWLEQHGLKVDYVRPPTSCDNIWRALTLVQATGVSLAEARAGTGRIVETHPRIALLALVDGLPGTTCIVGGYKTGDGSVTLREYLVRWWMTEGIVTCASPERLWQSADVFEALLSALAAASRVLGVARIYPGENLEGTYVLPARASVLAEAIRAHS